MNDAILKSAWHAHHAGNLNEAARLYGEVLRTNPNNFDALYSLGFVYLQSGRFLDAERLLAQATHVNPRSADAQFTRGCILQQLNRNTEAIVCFDRAASLRPGFAEALVNRGGLLMASKRFAEALQSFDSAIAAKPQMVEAWNNRGNALSELNRHADAVASYEKVLSLRPDLAQAAINRGTALIALKRFAEAIQSYDHALKADPSSLHALSGRANAFFEAKDYEHAAADYRALLKADVDYPYARGNLAFCELNFCDWHALNEHRAAIAAKLAEAREVINPFQSLSFLPSSREQLKCARLWAGRKYPVAEPLWRGKKYRHDKVRLAYLSTDFNEHAVSNLIAGVFEAHDRARFETIAVSYAQDDLSAMRRRLAGAFDRFIEVNEKTDLEVASMMRDMEVDIAVDLMGYTGDCRPGIFAHRPAPIQVNYLGFPGTMGAAFIDYILADPIVIPESDRDFFSESIVHLPDSYLPTDSKRRIAAETPSRRETGLPEHGFIFCAFNNAYKLSPDVFRIWLRLLHAVADSVLWLSQTNAVAVRNLQRTAEDSGIDPSRLIFAPFLPSAEHYLARMRLADLFLDTLPYNAHSTAADALFAGVPVLTVPGGTFAGRVAASLVSAAGLPEMMVNSLEEYEAMAIRLARDSSALELLKEELKRNRASGALFDTERMTRHLEAAYIKMWERLQNDEPASHFAIEASSR